MSESGSTSDLKTGLRFLGQRRLGTWLSILATFGACGLGLHIAEYECNSTHWGGGYSLKAPVDSAPKRSLHDFGDVLNDNLPLRWVFRFKNRVTREFRVFESIRSSTCCTAFGPLPERVKAGEILEIPVELKTSGKAGHLWGNFVVRTDSPSIPFIIMELRANLLDPFEVRGSGSPVEVVQGHPTTRRYEVILRTPSSGPIIWPAVSGMQARFEGKSSQPSRPLGGIVESTRILAISFDGNGDAGSRSDSILFTWPDGVQKRHAIGWEIVPPIRSTPRMVLVERKAGKAAYTVVLRSEDRPFRVLGVEGPGVRSFQVLSGEDSRISLQILLAPSGLKEVSRLEIATDHPRAAKVRLDVISLGAGRETLK